MMHVSNHFLYLLDKEGLCIPHLLRRIGNRLSQAVKNRLLLYFSETVPGRDASEKMNDDGGCHNKPQPIVPQTQMWNFDGREQFHQSRKDGKDDEDCNCQGIVPEPEILLLHGSEHFAEMHAVQTRKGGHQQTGHPVNRFNHSTWLNYSAVRLEVKDYSADEGDEKQNHHSHAHLCFSFRLCHCCWLLRNPRPVPCEY